MPTRMSSKAISRISISSASSAASRWSRRCRLYRPIMAPPYAASGGACRRASTLATARWRYCRSRMDELGIDFAHCYTTRGLSHVYIPEEDVRRTSCRALNMLYAEMYSEVGDRLRPAAVIPTYTPREAIEELEFAVTELGHKAVMIGTELRGPGRPATGGDPFLHPTQSTRSI